MTPDYPLIVALEHHPLDGTHELIATYKDGHETRQVYDWRDIGEALYCLARLELNYIAGHC